MSGVDRFAFYFYERTPENLEMLKPYIARGLVDQYDWKLKDAFDSHRQYISSLPPPSPFFPSLDTCMPLVSNSMLKPTVLTVTVTKQTGCSMWTSMNSLITSIT